MVIGKTSRSARQRFLAEVQGDLRTLRADIEALHNDMLKLTQYATVGPSGLRAELTSVIAALDEALESIEQAARKENGIRLFGGDDAGFASTREDASRAKENAAKLLTELSSIAKSFARQEVQVVSASLERRVSRVAARLEGTSLSRTLQALQGKPSRYSFESSNPRDAVKIAEALRKELQDAEDAARSVDETLTHLESCEIDIGTRPEDERNVARAVLSKLRNRLADADSLDRMRTETVVVDGGVARLQADLTTLGRSVAEIRRIRTAVASSPNVSNSQLAERIMVLCDGVLAELADYDHPDFRRDEVLGRANALGEIYRCLPQLAELEGQIGHQAIGDVIQQDWSSLIARLNSPTDAGDDATVELARRLSTSAADTKADMEVYDDVQSAISIVASPVWEVELRTRFYHEWVKRSSRERGEWARRIAHRIRGTREACGELRSVLEQSGLKDRYGGMAEQDIHEQITRAIVPGSDPDVAVLLVRWQEATTGLSAISELRSLYSALVVADAFEDVERALLGTDRKEALSLIALLPAFLKHVEEVQRSKARGDEAEYVIPPTLKRSGLLGKMLRGLYGSSKDSRALDVLARDAWRESVAAFVKGQFVVECSAVEQRIQRNGAPSRSELIEAIVGESGGPESALVLENNWIIILTAVPPEIRRGEHHSLTAVAFGARLRSRLPARLATVAMEQIAASVKPPTRLGRRG